MRHDWPVEKASVDLPIRLKGNLRHTSRNKLCSWWREGQVGSGTRFSSKFSSQTVFFSLFLRPPPLNRRKIPSPCISLTTELFLTMKTDDITSDTSDVDLHG